MTESFHQRVLQWYDQHGRKHLPWQNPLTPYRVWLSEIMLQQTQVNTVIPYFERFIQRFPSVQDLAAAGQDDVLHLWTGLGYYARARNLHRCAQAIVTEFGGVFPDDTVQLAQLPGIGRSTAAAITSIAFNQPTAILDGNVKRLLARHAAVEGWPGETRVSQALWQIAEQRMPDRRCREYTQAVMDLGATICTRSRPRCEQCPVAQDCLARATDRIAFCPGRKPRKALPVKSAFLLLVENPDGDILLQQRPPQGIWGGLWSLPELATEADLQSHIEHHYGRFRQHRQWPPLRHTFSHYHFDIRPVHIQLSSHPHAVAETDNRIWYNLQSPARVGLAAPVKSLLAQLQNPGLWTGPYNDQEPYTP